MLASRRRAAPAFLVTFLLALTSGNSSLAATRRWTPGPRFCHIVDKPASVAAESAGAVHLFTLPFVDAGALPDEAAAIAAAWLESNLAAAAAHVHGVVVAAGDGEAEPASRALTTLRALKSGAEALGGRTTISVSVAGLGALRKNRSAEFAEMLRIVRDSGGFIAVETSLPGETIVVLDGLKDSSDLGVAIAVLVKISGSSSSSKKVLGLTSSGGSTHRLLLTGGATTDKAATGWGPSPVITVPATNPAAPLITVTPTEPTVPIVPTNPSITPITIPPLDPFPTPITGPGTADPMPVPVTTNNPTPTTPSTASPDPAMPTGVGMTPLWCVAKPDSPEADLQNALDYACGQGAADCSAIQPTGSCYYPNTLAAHASYAFSSYYRQNPAPASCNFGSTAVLTNVDPSSGSCMYPSASLSASSFAGYNPAYASPITGSDSGSGPSVVNTTGSVSDGRGLGSHVKSNGFAERAMPLLWILVVTVLTSAAILV